MSSLNRSIYRHPSLTDINKFLIDLSSSLFELSNCNKSLYSLGNVNINTDQNNRTTLAIDYINVSLCHRAFAVITIPPRVTPTFATVIDHIISNDLKHEILPFVLSDCFTDHYPVACYVKAFNTKIFKNKADIIYSETNQTLTVKPSPSNYRQISFIILIVNLF